MYNVAAQALPTGWSGVLTGFFTQKKAKPLGLRIGSFFEKFHFFLPILTSISRWPVCPAASGLILNISKCRLFTKGDPSALEHRGVPVQKDGLEFLGTPVGCMPSSQGRLRSPNAFNYVHLQQM